jgi:hypothetical protein
MNCILTKQTTISIGQNHDELSSCARAISVADLILSSLDKVERFGVSPKHPETARLFLSFSFSTLIIAFDLLRFLIIKVIDFCQTSLKNFRGVFFASNPRTSIEIVAMTHGFAIVEGTSLGAFGLDSNSNL